MPRSRSRPNTEAKFQNAVLELVAEEGCCALGVNRVAQKAGADKVLIYRYFGDLNGLLQRVAESRSWLPSAHELLSGLTLPGGDAAEALRRICRELSRGIRADATTHQLVCWRKADKNPLTNYFTGEWRSLWRELPNLLAEGLDGSQRRGWKEACAVAALTIESELSDEPVDADCFERMAAGLEVGNTPEPGSEALEDDGSLPTNLL